MLAKGKYIQLKDFFSKGERGYQKIDDDFINREILTNRKAIPVICKAGTILIVNTTMLHRARPCTNGSRHALTVYFE
jgi:ectoine hydroxylase-related dioxygenase (phytanoyl-CoA dioxygenase family)